MVKFTLNTTENVYGGLLARTLTLFDNNRPHQQDVYVRQPTTCQQTDTISAN